MVSTFLSAVQVTLQSEDNVGLWDTRWDNKVKDFYVPFETSKGTHTVSWKTKVYKYKKSKKISITRDSIVILDGENVRVEPAN